MCNGNPLLLLDTAHADSSSMCDCLILLNAEGKVANGT